jgi:hypothetical protein
MTSILYCKSKLFAAPPSSKPVITIPSGEQFNPNQFGTGVHSSKSESQWIRSGIPSRTYVRILERDHHWRRL